MAWFDFKRFTDFVRELSHRLADHEATASHDAERVLCASPELAGAFSIDRSAGTRSTVDADR